MRSPLFLALACTAVANTALATSINETIEASIQYHPAVQSVKAEKEAASYNIKEAKGGYLPQVSASISTGQQFANNTTIRSFQDDSHDVWVNTANLSIQQLIYDGGNTSNRVVSAEKRYDAAGHLESERTQDVVLEAARVHLDVLRAQELVALAKSNAASHESYVEDIRDRARNGVITSTDAHHAEARLALAHASLMEEEEALLKANARYVEIVGQHPQDLKASSPISFSFNTQEEAIEYTLANNPTIAESFSTAQAADAEYKRTNSAFRPNVNFEVTSSVRDNSASSDLSNFNEQSHDTFAGFTMSWDLFRGGSDSARRESAASTKASTEALMKLAQRDAREEVSTIWHARTKLQDRIPLLESYSNSIHTVLEDYIDQFAVNRRDLLDLLDRQVESYRADSDLISASYDLSVKNYELLHATGQIKDQF